MLELRTKLPSKQTVVGVTSMVGVPGSPELLLVTSMTPDLSLHVPIIVVTRIFRSTEWLILMSSLFPVELPSTV